MKNIIKSLSAPTLCGIFVPLLFGIICAVLTFHFQQTPVNIPIGDSWLKAWLYSFIATDSVLLTVISFILSLLTAIALFLLNESYSFVRQRTMLPYFFFIFLTSIYVNETEIFFEQICCLLFVLALGQVFLSLSKQYPIKQAFNSSLLLSFGSLFTIELLFFIPLFALTMILFSHFSFRALLATIIGALTPYYIAFCLTFLFGNAEAFTNDFIQQFQVSLQTYDIPFFILMFVLSVVVVLSLISSRNTNKISVQRMLKISAILYLCTLILFAFFPNETNTLYLISIALCSILFTNFFESQKSPVIFYIFIAIGLSYYAFSFF